jgi:hypothetical protein
MKRFVQLLLLFLLINSCKTYESEEVVDELLIFGYSGFCFKDSLNQIYHSDEIFYNDSIKIEYDSTRLDIRQYFEYNKDSFINLALRRPRHLTEYLYFTHTDTIGLVSLINSTLINKNYKDHYVSHDTISGIYDGWNYTLYFKTSKDKKVIINYIPSYLPDSLRVLHEFIEKTLTTSKTKGSYKFEYNPITSFEAKRQFKRHPPPPLPSKTVKIKFTSPVIKGND